MAPGTYGAPVKLALPLGRITPCSGEVEFAPRFSETAITIGLFADFSTDVAVGALWCDLVTAHPRVPRAVSPRDQAIFGHLDSVYIEVVGS